MLQNAKVAAFIVSELLRENQQRGCPLTFTQIRDNSWDIKQCIAIACFPGCDVIKFEITFTILIKPFFYMIKNSKQIPKYLEDEKNFLAKIFSNLRVRF